MRLLSTFIAVMLSLTVCFGQTKNTNMNENNVLVAYFSATGTTEAQAKAIADATNATLFEITPATPYSDADLDWRNEKSRSSMENADVNSRPKLDGKKIDAASFDIIFIGYPIWWYVCPRVVNTWIESQNLKGKSVITFATSGSSSIDNSQKVLRDLYPDINWIDGKLLNVSSKSAAEWGKKAVNDQVISNTIISLEKHAMREWLNGNPSAFLDIYSKDYTYFDPSLEWRLDGWDKIKAIYDSVRGLIKEDNFEIINPSVQIYGSVAVLAYNLHITTGDKCFKENVTEVFTLEEDGKWRIIHSHFSMTQPSIK